MNRNISNIKRAVFIAVALCILSSAVFAAAPPPRQSYNGLFYSADVPDTLDLADMGSRALGALKDVTAYSYLYGEGELWGAVANARILAQNMTGKEHSYGLSRIDATAFLALADMYALDQRISHYDMMEKFAKEVAAPVEGSRDDSAAEGRGVLGYGRIMEANGLTLQAICAWERIGGEDLTELAGQYKDNLMQPKFWQPQAAPAAFTPSDRGQFSGDMAAYTECLLGLLAYAEYANDAQVKQLVRAGYDFIRNFGISSIGLFGELCTTAGMARLAVRMSLMGIGDYWDDAERYLRNELAEKQLASGLFISDSSCPTHVTPVNFRTELCCTVRAVQAIYEVWDAVVTGNESMAQVNLMLNRASPLLDVNSYLPYEGRVELLVKTAKAASVHLPKWIDRTAVTVAVNGADRPVKGNGQYVIIDDLKQGDIVVIGFPTKEWTETFTLLWDEQDTFKRGTEPGDGWKRPETPDQFTFTMRGFAVVDVESTVDRAGGGDSNYLTYQRSAMWDGKAPVRTVERFAPEVTLLSSHNSDPALPPDGGGDTPSGGFILVVIICAAVLVTGAVLAVVTMTYIRKRKRGKV